MMFTCIPVSLCPHMLFHTHNSCSIPSVVLDFMGGFLSLSQLFLDCGVRDDWDSITGDPVKLLLGLLTLMYDIVYLLQHYVWYATSKPATREGNDSQSMGATQHFLSAEGSQEHTLLLEPMLDHHSAAS
jgi:hypothetical protein